MKKEFTLLIVLLFAATCTWAQSTYTFPGNTLSGSFGGWGGTGHFYNPIFNVNAVGGIDITYYDIDVSQFTEANVGSTKGVAIPGVSKSNSMTSIDPDNNSIWCNILNMEIASGTDFDGHPLSTLGPDGTSGTSDDTRHQGTQDWYRGITDGKIDGPADGPYYNNESYVIPNPRHPGATPTSASELNKYDFRLRILPTGYHTYTYEMWFRMHKSAAQIEGAYWVYNIAMNNSADAWKKFAKDATDVFPVSNIDLSSVYVFMGLGNFQDPATHSLTWGNVVVNGTLITGTTIGIPTSSACGTLDVPVTVKDFKNIGAISLKLNYDPTKLQLLPIADPPYLNVTLNTAISGALVGANNTTGQFSLANTPVPAITLADDAVLFTLHFNVMPAAVAGSTTSLTWSTVSQECEYAGPGGKPVYVSTFNNNLLVAIPARPVKNIDTGREYCTIQAAIDDGLTVNGHTIIASAGTYKEQVNITKGLTIVGDISNPDNVIIDGENKTTLLADGQVRIYNPSEAVVFKGFKIINGGKSSSGGYYTILTKGSYSKTIENCKIMGHGSGLPAGEDYGLWANTGSGDIIIKNSYFTENYHAILIEKITGALTIENNTFDNLYTPYYEPYSGDVGGRAIEAITYGGTNITSLQKVSGNTFTNFRSTGIIFSGGFSGSGVGKFSNVVIEKNNFNFSISGIVNNYGAINLRNVSSGGNSDLAGGVTADIHNNIINVPSSSGIQISGLNGPITCHNNSILGTPYGMKADDALTTVINATCNWWGTVVAADIAAKVAGPVTYIPWLTSGADGSTDPGFQPTVGCDETPPVITCPAGVTVNQHQARDPYATGYATSPSATITYNDERSGLNLCNATGVITRTWTATDLAGNTASCVQTITVEDVDNPVVVVPANITVNTDPGLCSAVVTYANPTATDFGFFQGFENAAWVAGLAANNPSVDWNEYQSPIARVASGTDGITSKSGSAHAVINSTANITPNTTGAFCRVGGYNGTFGTGFISKVDVYFDRTDPGLVANTYGWDLDQAVSNNTAGFLRDFIYHVAGDNTGIYISVGNGSSNGIPGMSVAAIQAVTHATITSSGWYTMQWETRNNAGLLAVDFTILNDTGTPVWTTTINTTDAIATVGGNRYMWFNFVSANKLAIDNTSLTRKLAVTTDIASGTIFAKGVTTVNVSTTDACGKPATGSFTVTIADNEAPKITACAPAKSAVVTTGCSVAMPDFTSSVVATDNCAVTSITQVPAVGTMMAYQAEPYTVTITVKDAANNSVACNTATFTVQKATLSGTLVYNNTPKTPMGNVTLELSGAGLSSPLTTITSVIDPAGAFQFTGLCAGEYTIRVINNNKDAGGINATDAAQVNAWSANFGQIEHVKFLAGDVIPDKFISSSDALKIQRYFVFSEDFTAPKWSYWKKGIPLITNNTTPYNGIAAWPTDIKVTVSGDVSGLELYGMLTGDFDGSLAPSITKSAGSSLTLTQNGDLQIGANQAFELPIVSASAMKVGAVSMILQIPSELVKVQDVVIKGSKDPVMWAVKGNELRIGWYSLDPVYADENTSLVTLKLMTRDAFTTGRTIDISMPFDPLNELAEGNYMAIDNAALRVARVSNSARDFSIGQDKGLSLSNYPNPFTRSTTFKYTLPVSGKVTINLYNNMGQLVTTIVEVSQSAGQYSVLYESNSLQPGIYVARLRLVNGGVDMVGTIKLIIEK